VGVHQFVKGGGWKTGERKVADHLGIEPKRASSIDV
jgi:ATP:corrinoid adenosyltransferase